MFYGMPILIDNTNVEVCLPPQEHLLRNNTAADAFIITQIRQGAIILGKTNLRMG
jgi:amidase